MFHVEHTKPMRITWLVIVFGLLSLTACRQLDEHPELKDPIYADLRTKPDAFREKAKGQREKIADLKKDLAKMEPRDPNRKRTIKEIYDLERGLVFIDQEAEYYDVRAQQRLDYVRKAYLEAFNAGKDWPDPAEFEEYQKRKRLREAPRNWEARVPKLTRYLPSPTPSAKDKPKEEAKPAHGE
jgi:hypothetical protein